VLFINDFDSRGIIVLFAFFFKWEGAAMNTHRLDKKIAHLRFFFLLCPILILMAACGGGGGGSDSSDSSTNITTKELRVPFSSTVLDHFQDEIVTVKNDGTASSLIGQVAQANPLDAPFSILNDQCSGITLAPSATCTLQVRFLPTSQGTFSDTFDIPSDAGKTIMTVSVSGDGRALNVSINQIDTSGCPTIRLFITVTDRNDAPLTVLKQTDFSVFENNNLQAIDSFTNKVTTPISVALALDTSGSIKQYITDVEAAAKSFIDQLDLNNSTDEAAVIKFAASIELKQAFTDDKNSILLAIGDTFTGNPDKTLLYDALWQAIDITADPARNDRRAVVVLTDGIDEGSVDHNLTGVIDSAHEKGVPVFTIGLGNVFFSVLQIIADETGGQYFLSPTSSDLQAIYKQIVDILSNQYVIEYQSPSSGGAIIRLDVEVDANGLQGEDSRDVPGC
jgi:Ca-activated chloride channel family protein